MTVSLCWGSNDSVKIRAGWAGLVFFFCLAIAAAQDDLEYDEVEGGWQAKENGLAYMIKKKGDCAASVADMGDIVYITHVGFSEDGRQIDANVQGEHFKVTIGARQVIRGMEEGMIGQCLYETRLVRMPPQWAFDDPNLRFGNRKPVPTGTTVNYEITLHEVLRPGTLNYYWVAAVKQGGAPGLVFFLCVLIVLYCFYDSYTKKLKRGGGKKRR